MHVYMLLDRSGSMSDRWAEALGAINSYVADLAKNDATKSAAVTLATFDGYEGLMFDVLRNGVAADVWPKVTDADAMPRGMTPLFDAIGRLMGLADAAAPDKAVVVVMTDGHENASREVTKEGAKAAFDRARAKNWQVVFLGADFDAMGQAASVGTSAAQTLNTTKGNYARATSSLAAATADFASSGRAMAFSDADRKRAAGSAG
jgi:uncharacterized protein YegL